MDELKLYKIAQLEYTKDDFLMIVKILILEVSERFNNIRNENLGGKILSSLLEIQTIYLKRDTERCDLSVIITWMLHKIICDLILVKNSISFKHY